MMEPLLIAIISITALFFGILLLKLLIPQWFQKPRCALCIAVSLTWVALLTLNFLGLFRDTLLIAVLMGQSTVGVFYLLEAKVAERFTLFRLPFLLTLTALAYMILMRTMVVSALLSLISLWVLFALIFLFRDGAAQVWFKKILDCCRRW